MAVSYGPWRGHEDRPRATSTVVLQRLLDDLGSFQDFGSGLTLDLGETMVQKLVGLKEAAALVTDGAKVAIGGTILHRSPLALVRELARQRRRGIRMG